MFTRNLRSSLVLGCTLGLLLIPGAAVLAQARSDGLRDAAETVRCIQEGQIALRDAIAIAEKHTSGHALRAHGRFMAPGSPEGKADSYLHQDAARKLFYLVDCFDKGKLLSVRIDAASRQVVEVKPHKVRRPTAPATKP